MEYVRAAVLKFVIVTAILYIILSLFYGASFVNVLWTSLNLTFWAYLIGDLLLLPYAGNRVALVTDFGIAFLSIWIMAVYTFSPNVPLVSATLVATIAITVGEWFFHAYMRKYVMDLPEQQET